MLGYNNEPKKDPTSYANKMQSLGVNSNKKLTKITFLLVELSFVVTFARLFFKFYFSDFSAPSILTKHNQFEKGIILIYITVRSISLLKLTRTCIYCYLLKKKIQIFITRDAFTWGFLNVCFCILPEMKLVTWGICSHSKKNGTF